MTDSNGWPDASKPGVPANPERDGPHWFRWHDGQLVIKHWKAQDDIDCGHWLFSGGMASAIYIGPALTPAEHAAAVAAAIAVEREACAALLETMRRQHNAALIGQWHSADTSIAYQAGADAIRARGKPE
jgi:hypothetical protein